MYNYLVQKYRKESKKMKKISLAKIASLIFVCVMLFAALAIGVYADETTESIVPKDVFTFKGYSIDEDGNACFGFTLNPSAKEEYENQLGTPVDIGLVIAIYEDGKSPIDAEGNVYIGSGDSKKAIGELTEELTTFRIVVDFAGSAILAYDENGNVIETLEVESPNAKCATLEEWRQSLVDRNYILNWRAEGLGSICIESMRIEEGNAFN